MLRLKSTSHVPPKGWSYTHPESGAVIKGQTFGEWMRAIRDHHKANNYPIGLLFEADVQDRFCRGLGDAQGEFCEAVPVGQGNYPIRERRIGLDEVKRFISVMAAWIKSGEPFVEQEEAERRGEVCAGCFYNQEATGCRSCAGVAGLLAEVIGSRRTKVDSALKFCQICGCAQALSVHVPLAPQLSALTDEQLKAFPIFCWKRPISPDSIPAPEIP